MIIRIFEEADYDQVVDLYQSLDDLHVKARPDCFIHRSRDETYPREAFLQNLANPDSFQLGAFEGEQLVGFVRATLWHESEMVQDVETVCLDDIYVVPACRRRGIAAKLFAAVEAWAKEKGAIRLDLHVWAFNEEAIAMYQAMGMTSQRYVFEKKL